MGTSGERGRVRQVVASLAALAVGLCLVGAVGCAVATAGQPVTVSAAGAGPGTAGQGTGHGTRPGHGCSGGSARHAGPDRPDVDAEPLVSISGSSPWGPMWQSRATLALYPDGTVATIPDDRTSATVASVDTASSAALRPMVGGWIDECTFDRLDGQLDELIRADYGLPQVFDAASTSLLIDRHDARGPIEVSVYALQIADAPGLTAAQQRARRALADWIDELRGAVTVTGSLPDRVRITPTGNDPWSGSIVSPPAPEQDPVPWHDASVPTGCTVVTGDEAGAALASMRTALQARTSPTSRPIAWGIFTVPGGSGTAYLAEQQVVPGDGCR